MEGRRRPRSGSGEGASSRGAVYGDRTRDQMLVEEFELLLLAAQNVDLPTGAPMHFFLIPVLHRLSDIAELVESEYCRQPGVNVFENRRDSHAIGQVIRLATLNSSDTPDRYSEPSLFMTDVLFSLLRSGGGIGGGAASAAALCRFLAAVSMNPSEHSSRSSMPPPVPTLLIEDEHLLGVVLSWAKGEVPHTGHVQDIHAAATAIRRGRELVRIHRLPRRKRTLGRQGTQSYLDDSPGRQAARRPSSLLASSNPALAGSGRNRSPVNRDKEGERAEGQQRHESDEDGCLSVEARDRAIVAEVIDAHGMAADSLRAHAMGLVSAAFLSRQATDFAVSIGFCEDLVRRLRIGSVAEFLHAEVSASSRAAVSQGQAPEAEVTAAEASARGVTSTGLPAREGASPRRDGRDSRPDLACGRWPSIAAAEAEHVMACLSSLGGYQEILAPLFSDDGLAVLDTLLEQRQLEMRLHAVELLSALLTHKKVGLAFVRRGWVDTLLRLGCSSNAGFLEPEVAFCLQRLANSGGMMEAVCRSQSGSLERLLEYAANLLRSPSESTQRHALLFWDSALRFPPALEVFEQLGGISKLLYLLLPVNAQAQSDGGSTGGGRHGISTRSGETNASRYSSGHVPSSGTRSEPSFAGGGGGGRELYSSSSSVTSSHRRWQVTLNACCCIRQYMMCSLALTVLKQGHRAHFHRGQNPVTAAGGTGRVPSTTSSSTPVGDGQRDRPGQNHASGANPSSSPGSGVKIPSSSNTGEVSGVSPRVPLRPAWQCKPLLVDETSHSAHLAAVKGETLGVGVGLGGVPGYSGVGGASGNGGGSGVASLRGRDRATVRLGMHWPPATQLIHHRGVSALINVIDAMSSQRTMGADTALCALDALAVASLCPQVYTELCRPSANNAGVPVGVAQSSATAGPAGASLSFSNYWSYRRNGSLNPSSSIEVDVDDDVNGDPRGGEEAASNETSNGISGIEHSEAVESVAGWVQQTHSRLGVDVLLDAAAGAVQRDPGVMKAALRVLETCCRPHMACGPCLPSGNFRVARTFTGENQIQNSSMTDKRGADSVPDPSFTPRFGSASAASSAPADGSASGTGSTSFAPKPGGCGNAGVGEESMSTGGGASANVGGKASSVVGGVRGQGSAGRERCAGGDALEEQRTVDDRLQRPVRKLVRERNGIRVLVGLLKYRRQAAAADSVRLRAALCLLGLAHDSQIAQVLEKMRITTTLSDIVRAGPIMDRNMAIYSQLQEAVKQIIERVAGRLSGTVGRSGLMDPAVTRLERAAVVANTPITFQPRELLAIIHEYLAAKGLDRTAGLLAAEAGLQVSCPNLQPQTPVRRSESFPSVSGSWGASGAGVVTPASGKSLHPPTTGRTLSCSLGKLGKRSRETTGGPSAQISPPSQASAASSAAATGALATPVVSTPKGSKRSLRGGPKRLSFSSAVTGAGNSIGSKSGSGSGLGLGSESGHRTESRSTSKASSGSVPGSASAAVPVFGGTKVVSTGASDSSASRSGRRHTKSSSEEHSCDGTERGEWPIPKRCKMREPRPGDVQRQACATEDIVAEDAHGEVAPSQPVFSPVVGDAFEPAHDIPAPSPLKTPSLPSSSPTMSRKLGPITPAATGAAGNTLSSWREAQRPIGRVATAFATPSLFGPRRSDLGTDEVMKANGRRGLRAGRSGDTCGGEACGGTGRDTGTSPRLSQGRARAERSGKTLTPQRDGASGAAVSDFAAEEVLFGYGPFGNSERRGYNGSLWRGDWIGGSGSGGIGYGRQHVMDSDEGAGGSASCGADPSRATALDAIVTSFLRNQHERCPNPVCVLPPLSLSEPHVCPQRVPPGRTGAGAPLCLTKRAFRWQAVPPLGGRGGARLQRAFVYSRFRRCKSFTDPDHVITASAFARKPGMASRLWAGTDAGVVRLWETFGMLVEGRWRVSQYPVTSIEQHPGGWGAQSFQSVGSGNAGLSSPLLLTSVGHGVDCEVLLWRALGGADAQDEDDHEQEEQPLYRWARIRAARFDHGGTRAVAVVNPHPGGLNVPGAGGGQHQSQHPQGQAWGAQVLDVETGVVLAKLWDARSRPLYPFPNVGFNATDDLVVTDGALWDPMRGVRVHQFDKLGSGAGFGLFHPNGNEVLVDEGVWDLRTYRLLRTLPCQDGTVMQPSPGGEILFTYRPMPSADYMDFPHKRSAQDTSFGVLDSSTYEQIHSLDIERAIVQLSTDESDGYGNYISVVERMDPLTTDTMCSLYAIGRKPRNEADSDLDDAPSESSDEEWEDVDPSDQGEDPREDGTGGGGNGGWRVHVGSSGDDDSSNSDSQGSDSEDMDLDGRGRLRLGDADDGYEDRRRRRQAIALYNDEALESLSESTSNRYVNSSSSSTSDHESRQAPGTQRSRRRGASRRRRTSMEDNSGDDDSEDEGEEDTGHFTGESSDGYP